MNEVAKSKLEWNYTNSVPYVIAVALPTVLLIAGLIPPLHWTILFAITAVGAGLVDLKSVEIAGSGLQFDDDDGSSKSKEKS